MWVALGLARPTKNTKSVREHGLEDARRQHDGRKGVEPVDAPRGRHAPDQQEDACGESETGRGVETGEPQDEGFVELVETALGGRLQGRAN